jgi:hypothetical protein
MGYGILRYSLSSKNQSPVLNSQGLSSGISNSSSLQEERERLLPHRSLPVPVTDEELRQDPEFKPKSFHEIWLLCIAIWFCGFCSAAAGTLVANLQMVWSIFAWSIPLTSSSFIGDSHRVFVRSSGIVAWSRPFTRPSAAGSSMGSTFPGIWKKVFDVTHNRSLWDGDLNIRFIHKYELYGLWEAYFWIWRRRYHDDGDDYHRYPIYLVAEFYI